MNNLNSDPNRIGKNVLIKSWLLGVVQTLLLVWLVSYIMDGDFITVLLFMGALYIGWVIYRAITSAIAFHLFLKSDLIEGTFRELTSNNFPRPEDYEIDNPEDYLSTVVMDAENHPRNVIAATMLSEFSQLRRQSSILGILRLNRVMREVLRKYRYQLDRK